MVLKGNDFILVVDEIYIFCEPLSMNMCFSLACVACHTS
jgi:hypothetical protein